MERDKPILLIDVMIQFEKALNKKQDCFNYICRTEHREAKGKYFWEATNKKNSLIMHISASQWGSLCWGYRIHRQQLCWWVNTFQKCPGYDTRMHLMVRNQPLSFEECTLLLDKPWSRLLVLVKDPYMRHWTVYKELLFLLLFTPFRFLTASLLKSPGLFSVFGIVLW